MQVGNVYMSTDSHLIKVVNTATSKTRRADEIANETAKISKDCGGHVDKHLL
jgi:hypothetical protein